MDVGVYAYTAGDPVLIDKIVNEFLSQGKFDKLRKECMADADTKPAYQNLQQRVESTVTQFLKQQVWKPDINKNQLRDSLRKHILESGFLDAGINRIVDQIVNPNVLATVFMPEVEEVVYSYLSIPRPGDKSNKHCDNAKTYSNYKVKHQSADELKGKLDIDKDLKKSQKNEENQTNNFYERLKSEDFEDKTNAQKCENISSAESVTDLQMETTRDIQNEIKLEAEETEAMKECKFEMIIQEDGNDSNGKFFSEKMEVPSDDSQESLSRMGVERLRISDSDGINAPDSDASLPLEINEKSMSDSRDSDDSIMNKMSPISQGRLTPEDACMEEEKEMKEEKEGKEGKKPLTFIGRIPKIKRDDSELKKAEEIPKRLDAKSVCSSDESDSSKHSSSKSDAEEKNKKKKKKKKKTATEEERPEGSKEKSDKKYKDEDRKRKSDHCRSSDGRSRSRDEKREKSRSRRDEKDKSHSGSREDRSRDKNSSGDKKSSSSSSHSRSSSSSHHKSGHKSGSHEKEHHRDDSRSREKDRSRHDRKDRDKRDFDKRKKEEEKRKKSKSVDDHGKERNRRDDRRSTDRDSNERERDKTKDTGSGVVQSDGKKRENNQKEETRREKNQKEESDSRNEREGESAQTVKTEETVVMSKTEEEEKERGGSVTENVTSSQSNCPAEVVAEVPSGVVEPEIFDLKALFEKGALTKVRFPKVVDDFYVKFDSTGFRYFEDWETTKLDCEEEFKEYIDEAERDLALLSDDGSDYESCEKHASSEAMKRAIIEDSLRGVGNFQSSLMFDPVRYEFYAWKDENEYRLRKGKEAQDVGRWGSDRTREVDEEEMQCQADKNKENRDRGRRIRKSLKFLNRYHRKIGLTLKRGREQHRFVSRPRKPFPFGRGEIRERNAKPMDELKENQPEDVGQDGSSLREDGEKSGEESVASTVPKMDVDAKIRLYQIQSMRRSKPESCQAKILARLTSGSKVGVDAEHGNENVIVEERVAEVDEITKKVRKKGIRIGLPRPRPRPRTDLDVDMNRKLNQSFSLPLSPESDDSLLNSNGVISHKDAAKAIRKRPGDGYADLPAKKDCKRTLNQKYESQDLYKPRPFSIGSKTRGRALRVEENNFGEIDDGDK